MPSFIKRLLANGRQKKASTLSQKYMDRSHFTNSFATHVLGGTTCRRKGQEPWFHYQYDPQWWARFRPSADARFRLLGPCDEFDHLNGHPGDGPDFGGCCLCDNDEGVDHGCY